MRRLPLQRASAPPDARPALLAVVALMLLLLPFLLLTTSPQKLAAMDLHIASSGGESLPGRTGAVEAVSVRLQPDGAFEVSAAVRRTDLGAREGDTEKRIVRIPALDADRPDLAGLQGALLSLRGLDSGQTRARLLLPDALPTGDVVRVVDAVRLRHGEPFFPDVVLDAETEVTP